MTEHDLTPFRRGLSEEFMLLLSAGLGRRLLDMFVDHQLDVRLRNNYFNAYRAQSSVARVRWQVQKQNARVEIDRAYLAGTKLLLCDDKIQKFDLSEEFLDMYELELPRIRSIVDTRYASPEGRSEAKCVEANLEGTSFHVIDRQIVNSRPLLRLDMLALSIDTGHPAILATELKRDLDARIQHVPSQLAGYLDMLDPAGQGFRTDVANSYRRVCEQLRSLGFSAPDPSLIRPGMEVIGLVALANYNPKSALLGRALEEAGMLPRRIHFCFVGANGVMPPARRWFVAAVA